VLNRGDYLNGNTPAATIAPTITSFTVGEDGSLFAVPNATVTLPLGLSSAQLLASANGQTLFVDNFAGPDELKTPLADTIEPFSINANGSLTAVPKGAAGLPANPPLVLGLVEDPIHHLIYSGNAPVGEISVFSYSASGKVSYVTSVPSQGAGSCWLQISPDGKYLYSADSGSNQVSVFSLKNPLAPAFVQEFTLAGPTNSKGVEASNDFQFSFDPGGKYIWIVSHTTDSTFQAGNQLHTLVVAGNGTLSEPNGPQILPANWVPASADPQGIAVVTPEGYYGGYASQSLPRQFDLPSGGFGGIFANDASQIRRLVDQLFGEVC
jgi:DNA-binding beta-propeller fold protein YncE